MIFYDADVIIPLGIDVRAKIEGVYSICKVRAITKPDVYFFVDKSEFAYTWTEHGFIYNYHYDQIITGHKTYIKQMIVGKLCRITPI